MTLGAGIGLGLAYQKCETTVTSFSVKDFGKVVKVSNICFINELLWYLISFNRISTIVVSSTRLVIGYVCKQIFVQLSQFIII